MRDAYSVLQVAPKASDAEIKAAYRNLAKALHPDVRPGDHAAEQAFQHAKSAYELLSNPETRKAYDDYRAGLWAAERSRRRRAAASMSATFLLTATTVAVTAVWLYQADLAFGRLITDAMERSGVFKLVQVPAQAGQRQVGAAARMAVERADAFTGTSDLP